MRLVAQLFPVGERDVADVRAIYAKTVADVAEDVGEVRKWLLSQEHVEEDDARVERFLLRNKFRVEQTKTKIEAYYTLRRQYSDLFVDRCPGSEDWCNIRRAIKWIPLPKLTPKKERVVINTYDKEAVEFYDLDEVTKYVLSIMDVQLSYDYAVGERIVLDMKEFTMSHIRRLSIRGLFKAVKLHQTAFSGRLTGIELVNPPTFLKLVLALGKMVFPTKLYQKITVHDSLDSLHRNIPRDCLTEEYGGTQTATLENLHDDVGDMLVEMKDFLVERLPTKNT